MWVCVCVLVRRGIMSVAVSTPKHEKQITKVFHFSFKHVRCVPDSAAATAVAAVVACGFILATLFEQRIVNFFIRDFMVAPRANILTSENFAKLKSCSEYIFTFQCEEEMRYEMLIDHIKWETTRLSISLFLPVLNHSLGVCVCVCHFLLCHGPSYRRQTTFEP